MLIIQTEGQLPVTLFAICSLVYRVTSLGCSGHPFYQENWKTNRPHSSNVDANTRIRNNSLVIQPDP